jgi:hypothetical protein
VTFPAAPSGIKSGSSATLAVFSACRARNNVVIESCSPANELSPTSQLKQIKIRKKRTFVFFIRNVLVALLFIGS